MNDIAQRKRTLSKIRRPFLNRESTESETPNQVEKIPSFINTNKTNEILPWISLSEKNRKICFDETLVEKHFTLTNLAIEFLEHTKAATMSFEKNENSLSFPWQYTVDRLESYGDSSLLPWAQKIRSYYTNYSQMMKRYFELIHLGENKIYQTLRKAKTRATLACREIEEKFSYVKAVHFSNENSINLVAYSVDEGYLKIMGFTFDEFSSVVRENGLDKASPFDSDSQVHMEHAKEILDGLVVNGNPLQLGPEFPLKVCVKDGTTQECNSQKITIIEPTPEGIFIYAYYIIKEKSSGSLSNKNGILDLEKINFQEGKSLMDEMQKEITGNDQTHNDNSMEIEEF